MPSAYWDSCVFLSLLQKTPGRFDDLAYIIDLARKKQFDLVTSTFTITEVAKLPDCGKLNDEQAKQIAEIFENPYIIVRQLDRTVALLAQELVRCHGIKPPDAVHAATAIEMQVEVLHTYDKAKGSKGLLRFDGKLGDPPLAIKMPTRPSGGPLFQETEKADAETAAHGAQEMLSDDLDLPD